MYISALSFKNFPVYLNFVFTILTRLKHFFLIYWLVLLNLMRNLILKKSIKKSSSRLRVSSSTNRFIIYI